MSLARKSSLLSIVALLAVCAATASGRSTNSGLVAVSKPTGAKLNPYGDGWRATRGLAQFGLNPECTMARDGSLLVWDGKRIAKLTRNGKLSKTFSVRKFRSVGVRVITAVEFLSDGRILVAGKKRVGSGYRPVLMRLGRGGEIDPSFGVRGSAMLGVRWTASFYETLIRELSDGRLAVAFSTSNGDSRQSVLLLTERGNPAKGFGDDGVLRTALDISDIVAMPGGALLLAGNSGAKRLIETARLQMHDSNGRLEPSWGSDGVKEWSELPASVMTVLKHKYDELQKFSPTDKPFAPDVVFHRVDGQLRHDGSIAIAIGSGSFGPFDSFVWTTLLDRRGKVDTEYGDGGALYRASVNDDSRFMDEGDFVSVDWSFSGEQGLVGVWQRYHIADDYDEVSMSLYSPGDSGDTARKAGPLRVFDPSDVEFDGTRNRALVCGQVGNRASVVSVRLK
jgi:hypothetical protein